MTPIKVVKRDREVQIQGSVGEVENRKTDRKQGTFRVRGDTTQITVAERDKDTDPEQCRLCRD